MDGVLEGVVSKYDPNIGVAEVEVASRQNGADKPYMIKMHLGAFYSGRLERPPKVGDKVTVEIGSSREGTEIAVYAELRAA